MVGNVVAKYAVGGNRQIPTFVFNPAADAEVEFGHTRFEDFAVVGGYLAVFVDVLVDAIANSCAGLIFGLAFGCGILVPSVELCLVLDNAFVTEAVELTEFFAEFGVIIAGEVVVVAKAEGNNLVFQCRSIDGDVVFNFVLVVVIRCAPLEAAVFHLCGVHCNRFVAYACRCRYGYAVKKVFRNVLVPLECEVDLAVEKSQIHTDRSGFFLLPRDCGVVEC